MARLIFNPVILEVVSEHIGHVEFTLYPYSETANWYTEISANRWKIDIENLPESLPIYRFKNSARTEIFNKYVANSLGQVAIGYVDSGNYTVVAKFTVGTKKFYFVQEKYAPGVNTGEVNLLGLTQNPDANDPELAPSSAAVYIINSRIQTEKTSREVADQSIEEAINAINVEIQAIKDADPEFNGVTEQRLNEVITVQVEARTTAINNLNNLISAEGIARENADIDLAQQIQNATGIVATTTANMLANSVPTNLWFVTDANENEGVWYHSNGVLGLHQWDTGVSQLDNPSNVFKYKTIEATNGLENYTLDAPITNINSARLDIDGGPSYLPPLFNITDTTLTLDSAVANLISTGTILTVSYL